MPQEKFKIFSSVPFEEKKSNLNIRHGGVIGLCSFINAYPYTVPPELPPLFADIGNHLRDPEPIPVSSTVADLSILFVRGSVRSILFLFTHRTRFVERWTISRERISPTGKNLN